MGFFALVWRILEGVRKVLHLILLLIIFGFVLAALHTSIPSVPRSAALVIARRRDRRAAVERSGAPRPWAGFGRPRSGDPSARRDRCHRVGQERLAHQADCAGSRQSVLLGPVETARD